VVHIWPHMVHSGPDKQELSYFNPKSTISLRFAVCTFFRYKPVWIARTTKYQ
jgi:hypothetical protein